MPRIIFINLPVADLARTTAFYEAIGFTKNPEFCGETASCMVLSDTIHVMLTAHDFFRTFTPKAVSDARTTSEVLLCISCDDRAAVDIMTEAAANAGGRADIHPPQDHGFMYDRSFEDLDGHLWGPMWMDLDAFRKARETVPAAA